MSLIGVAGALLLLEALTWVSLAYFYRDGTIAKHTTVIAGCLVKAGIDVTLAAGFLYGGIDVSILIVLYVLAHVVVVSSISFHYYRSRRTKA